MSAATYTYAVSWSGNGREAGHTSWATYTSAAERMPITKQVMTVASMILRLGFSASSESVEMASKPMYVSTASEVHQKRPLTVNIAGSKIVREWKLGSMRLWSE